MKIDLHCHTQSTKDEGIERNISVQEMIPILVSKEVEIASITNHNLFDIEEFNELCKLGRQHGIQFYPGVELDVIGLDNEHAHVIIVIDPNEASIFSDLFSSVAIQSPKTFNIKLSELLEKINDLDFFFIAHYNKKPELTKNSLNYVAKNIENFRIFLEPSNFRGLSIFSNKGHSCLIGSDVKDWSKYLNEDNILPELKLKINSFHELVLLAKRDKDIINTLLNRVRSINLNIDLIRQGSKDVFRTENLDLYDDINVIFGGKGSGKSKYLEFIRTALIKLGQDPVYYNSDDAKDVLEDYKKISENEFVVTNIEENLQCTNFTTIQKWETSTPTSLDLYFDAINTSKNKRNRVFISIIERTMLRNEYQHLIEKYSTMYEKFLDFKEWFKDLEKSSMTILEEKTQPLLEILEILEKSSFELYKENWVGDRAITLANDAIQILKDETDILSNGRSIPNIAGLEDLFTNLITPYKVATDFKEFLSKNARETIFTFADLEENKKLSLRTTYTPYNPSVVKASTFQFKSRKITELNQTSEMILKVYSTFCSNQYKQNIINLIEKINEFEINDFSEFVCISRRYCTDDEDYYKPSSGEEKVVAFQKILEQEKKYYLLDEPEKSLGSFYTSSVILPKIKRLSDLGKCVVCTTHSANIAVLGMPYQTILKEYCSREYKTFVGNMYINKLSCINDPGLEFLWSDKSLELLEGGEHAFNERSYAYAIK